MIQLNDNDPEVRKILDAPGTTTEERYAALQELKEQKRYAADDGVITPAQQVFIDAMVAGASQAEAYRMAYPKATEASVYSSASRLMDRPSIQQRIEDGQMELHLYRLKTARQKVLKKIADITDKREVLYDIIHKRQIGKVTSANQDTGATHIKFKEDPMVCIQAIKLDLKLEEILERLEDELARLPDMDVEPELMGLSDEEDLVPGNTEDKSPPVFRRSTRVQRGGGGQTAQDKKKKAKKPCETLLKEKTPLSPLKGKTVRLPNKNNVISNERNE